MCYFIKCNLLFVLETSMSKRPALDESDDAIFNTPSVFGTAKRQRKMKSTNSTLARKKKRMSLV